VRHGRPDSAEEIRVVGKRLKATLEDLRETRPAWEVVPGATEYADSPDAQATAFALEQTADLPAPKLAGDMRQLGPPRLRAYMSRRDVEQRIDEAKTSIDDELRSLAGGGANALVLVGHEPAIDWFLTAHVRGRLAVASGELVCLVRRRGAKTPWRLWWTITPSASAAIAELRDKIRSKMTVLSVLAGFAASILAQTLFNLPDGTWERRTAVAAAICFATSIVLLVSALLSYDRLMMPARFWQARFPPRRATPASAFPAWRPPASAAWVLFQHSVRLWRWVVVALGLWAGGIWLLAVALAWPTSLTGWLLGMLATVVTASAAVGWWVWLMPRLGTED
jgi:hypothetical protein